MASGEKFRCSSALCPKEASCSSSATCGGILPLLNRIVKEKKLEMAEKLRDVERERERE
jgi:hypothetical protein